MVLCNVVILLPCLLSFGLKPVDFPCLCLLQAACFGASCLFCAFIHTFLLCLALVQLFDDNIPECFSPTEVGCWFFLLNQSYSFEVYPVWFTLVWCFLAGNTLGFVPFSSILSLSFSPLGLPSLLLFDALSICHGCLALGWSQVISLCFASKLFQQLVLMLPAFIEPSSFLFVPCLSSSIRENTFSLWVFQLEFAPFWICSVWFNLF